MVLKRLTVRMPWIQEELPLLLPQGGAKVRKTWQSEEICGEAAYHVMCGYGALFLDCLLSWSEAGLRVGFQSSSGDSITSRSGLGLVV